jgi:hypothetical protein
MSIILAMSEAEIRRIKVQFQPQANNSWRLCLENTQYKNRVGVVAQMVEHLSSKCKVLSSNPNSAPPTPPKRVF